MNYTSKKGPSAIVHLERKPKSTCSNCNTFSGPIVDGLCEQCAIHKKIHRLDIERARLVKLLKKERGASR